ncbi:c-type cytochrome [Rhodoferax sp.]|uniref:c-type cytochrome n=1 Tax=Rhodoferax sp. TaxID=50421 RepID=UPI0026378E46|nr:c-type cytochrome [Rhodoferax sp.]MDD2924737.1 c-type cytochrome [Rhodoferax sp.]
MNRIDISHLLRALLAVGLTSGALVAQAQAVDVAAAEALLTANKCTKCHSLDKQKDGPSYKKTAAKYKGKADAEAKLFTHVTTGPQIEIDGAKEEHQKIKAKDDAAVKNLVRYILSR